MKISLQIIVFIGLTTLVGCQTATPSLPPPTVTPSPVDTITANTPTVTASRTPSPQPSATTTRLITPTPLATRTPQAPAATPAPTQARELRLTTPHLQGADVTALQQQLLHLGYSELIAADGDFGALTDQTVRRFQRDNGLYEDGIVGPLTWAAIFQATATGHRTPVATTLPLAFARVLDFVTEPLFGPDVDAVYYRLAELGYFQNCAGLNDLPEAGILYELHFTRVVRDFQAAHTLPVTGAVDQTTWEQIFSPSATPAPKRIWVAPNLSATAPSYRNLIAATRMEFGNGMMPTYPYITLMLWNWAENAPLKTPLPIEHNYTPAWSPDGARLAFFSEHDGRPEIFVMNADGSDLTQVTCGGAVPTALDEFGDLTWSPDGTRLAFAGTPGIYEVRLDGSGTVQMIANLAEVETLNWSPDGARLAATTQGALTVINLDGTGGYPVPTVKAFGADWSPDSAWLVITDEIDLWTITPRGETPTRLTRLEQPWPIYHPSWSADGGRVVFEYRDMQDYHWQLAVVNVDGSGLTVLPISRSGLLLNPEWQP